MAIGIARRADAVGHIELPREHLADTPAAGEVTSPLGPSVQPISPPS